MPDENLRDPVSNGMHKPASDARLQNLLERICDQSVDAAELEELGVLLAADKKTRDYYLEYLSLHSSLQNYGLPALHSSVCDSCESDFENIPGRPAIRRRTLAILATAATIAAVAAGIYFHSRHSDVSSVVADLKDSQAEALHSNIARVSELSDDILWQSPNESVALHSHVGTGHILQLARGEMRLMYDTGVELRLLGPAEFVVGPTGGRLLRGGVRAMVPEKGRGFTIETPNGKVIDLGTEFGVAVDDFGVCEVNVFQGMVDMVSEVGGEPARTMRLTKGEAVQWSTDTLIRLKADAAAFGNSSPVLASANFDDSRPTIGETFEDESLDESEWSKFGNAELKSGALLLQDAGDSNAFPYLLTTRQFTPNNGPITVFADIRFININPNSASAFAILTRSASERDTGIRIGRRTMRTGVRCSFKSAPSSSSATIEIATKLDPLCSLTNKQWRGFDQLQENVPYRLVMRDDGINVTFTVSLRDDPSVNKTVACRSLFRGQQNYIVFEGANGAVAVDGIKIFQDSDGQVIANTASHAGGAPADDGTERMRRVTEQLASMAPLGGRLVVSDNFDGPVIDDAKWTTLDDVALVDGRVQLGKPNNRQHINTFTARPYLLTRERFSPREGALTVVGIAEFDTNFLNEYGGSFAVMTRADNSRGKGPGWEYSILQRGIRENFWPAAWGQQHSLEIHEKPSPSSLSLLVAQGLEINPETREYVFKVVDDGENVTLMIQDSHDASINKTVSVHTSSALKDGFVGFESCWGCPVWLDNVQIYQADAAKVSSEK